jgi:Fe-S-cluster containining protein
MSNLIDRPKKVSPLLINKEIAYKGAIGQKRETFCIAYLEKKREIIEDFNLNQIKAVSSNGETISCQKGCSQCCVSYMMADVQECEAIVYYLYQHETVLSAFLKNYRNWRAKLKQNRDIFNECGRLWRNNINPGADEKAQRALRESGQRYQRQNIYCPFLSNNSCLIYEARPFTCAALVATTPPQWCSPSSVNNPKTYVRKDPIVFDTSFYYNQISEIIMAFMPLFVYGILKDGYKLLSSISGLENLEKTAMEDPQVRDILERLQ